MKDNRIEDYVVVNGDSTSSSLVHESTADNFLDGNLLYVNGVLLGNGRVDSVPISHSEKSDVLQNFEEVIANGYMVKNLTIVETATGKAIDDAEIDVLELDYELSHWLWQGGYKTVSSLIGASFDDIQETKNIRTASTLKIKEKLEIYLKRAFECGGKRDEIDNIPKHCESIKALHKLTDRPYPLSIGSREVANDEKDILAPDYVVVGNAIVHRTTRKVIGDSSIAVLDLSCRPYRGLCRKGYKMISSLVGVPFSKLLTIKNLGLKSVVEIQEKLENYFKWAEEHSETVAELNTEVNDSKEVFVLPPALPVLTAEFLAPTNDDKVILAPDYVVVGNAIVHRTTRKAIGDSSIDVLDLSYRPHNWLSRGGYKTIASLVGISFDELKGLRNIGVTSALEIQEKLEQYLERVQKQSDVMVEVDKTVSQYDILSCFRGRELSCLTLEDIMTNLSQATAKDIAEVLESMTQSGKIECKDCGYFLKHPSFREQIELVCANMTTGQPHKRGTWMLRERLNGATLESIGERGGLTRERARQLSSKAMDVLTGNDKEIFEEDKHRYLYEFFDLEKECFTNPKYIGEDEFVWNYLAIRYSRGKTPLEESLADASLTVELRRAIEKYLHRRDIVIEGRYVPAQRSAIENYVLERYCKDEMSVEDFFKVYNNFVVDEGLGNDWLITEAEKRTREQRLSSSLKILWKQNQKLRYYDIKNGDYAELLETLNLGQYHDIELSTYKFFVNYPDIMKYYDLRDEYELHNLLKKINPINENSSLEFGRMPTLKFGTFNREEYVVELFHRLAPMDLAEFAEVLSCELGFQPETIRANWIKPIAEYFHQGVCIFNQAEMPIEQRNKLKAVLTDDFYFISDVKEIYKHLFPIGDDSLLTAYNFQKMGFLVSDVYILQNHNSFLHYLECLFSSKMIMDVDSMDQRLIRHNSVRTYIAVLKKELEIIEFEPCCYINIRKLEEQGYSKEQLRQYGNRVYDWVEPEGWFTAKALRQWGYDDELYMLGFKGVFFDSILKADKRFAWRQVGGTTLFRKGEGEVLTCDFLVAVITSRKTIDADQLSQELANIYGIDLDKSSLIQKVRNTDVYYDVIMDKFYANYSLYFEEL